MEKLGKVTIQNCSNRMEWHKNKNGRENMYTNKPKCSHKEM